MKRYLISSALLLSTAFFIGCGNNGSSVSDAQFTYDTSSIFGFSKDLTYKNYVVKVVDDPIVNATVKATNCETFKEVGDGEYFLEKCVGKPTIIEIKGGKIKDKNVSQDFPLLLNVAATNEDDNFIVTPLTTILATANDENITELANKLGVSRDDLFSSNDDVKELFPKINAILIKAAAQGAITNKVNFLDVVREAVIGNIKNNDINITGVLNEVKTKSQSNPNLFGLVIIGSDEINDTDPLETITKMQNAKKVNFYGLVFDGIIGGAKVVVKDIDTDKIYDINASSDDTTGAWNFEIDENETEGSLYYTIMHTNHLLQFIASKGKIKLTSTVTTENVRNLIEESKIISPSKDNSLIVSNVTTAQDAILDKKGALNSASYEGNLSDLRVYYQDKVITAAALIKAVVDNNASTNSDANNTYELVKNSINDNENLDINTSVVDANVSEIEENITNNTILSSQLNNTEVTNENKDEFQNAAKKAGYVFYRLLAYYKENEPKTDENFVREYTRIIVYPGYYQTKTCYLEGDSTGDWNCSKIVEINNSSNFTLGQYEIDENNSITNYSLDFNSSFDVKDLNKTYNYYGIIKSEQNLSTGITTTDPMILVDDYDVVDAFRRMPTFDNGKEFQELKDIVSEYNTKREVNFALNRWIKNNFIDSVGNYFDSNTTN